MPCHKNYGFSLIELSVALSLGLLIIAGLMQMFASHQTTNLRQKAQLELSQKSNWLSAFFEQAISQAGMFNPYDINHKYLVYLDDEKTFITTTPVVQKGLFVGDINIGSSDGLSDSLVINVSAKKSCTGSSFKSSKGDINHIVNELYLADNNIRCRAYDGRYLRALQKNTAPSTSVSIMDNVYSLQFEYLVKRHQHLGWMPISEVLKNEKPIAVKVEVIIKNHLSFYSAQATIKSLNGITFNSSTEGMYQDFELIVPIQAKCCV